MNEASPTPIAAPPIGSMIALVDRPWFKAGLIALTKSLGKELAGTGVVVNCITPAAARTPIFDQMKQEHIDYMLSKIPLNRFLEPEEAAALIAWLASEECAFSTGAVFDISGGRATY